MSIDTMEAGRDIDALVAEKVMGYEVERGVSHYDGMEMQWMSFRDPQDGARFNPIPYSTDIAAAWQVVEKMRSNGYFYELLASPKGLHSCWFWRGSQPIGATQARLTAWGYTSPLAICRAALKAVGYEPIT